MKFKDFAKAGHAPTLFSAFLYFDMSFMVWVLLGPLGVHIAKDLGLSPSQKGMMVAIPVLSGAILRVFMGLLVDSIGAKLAGLIGQGIVLAALTTSWMYGIHSLEAVYILGICLGVAGASFAVALPLASRWYPPEAQGLALGIAGAGNSGTVFAALFAPLLANHFGWTNVFGLVLIPLSLTMIIYAFLAKDAPGRPPAQKLSRYFLVLKERDAWWFMLLYLVTFGGFVGLASSLVIYFNSQFGIEPATAGYLTAACVFCGSMFRPIGGTVADRVGGVRALQVMYVMVVLTMLGVAVLPTSLALSLSFFIVGMMAMGMGNGAVFQLLPQRFQKEIGTLTGLVGMAGGVGGFYLASSLGLSKQLTGDYRMGFLMYAFMGVCAFGVLFKVKMRWRSTWGSPALARARV
ncbi:MAG: NarK/NasA family nitrate transporter [Fibrobacterota bacterium]|nr:NarK/NasA family nitrate transporter [Fibrobacterota bacterium]